MRVGRGLSRAAWPGWGARAGHPVRLSKHCYGPVCAAWPSRAKGSATGRGGVGAVLEFWDKVRLISVAFTVRLSRT